MPLILNGYDFLVIETNLAISSNLTNIFFLEFDLNGKDKEQQLKFLKEVNNDFVDKEINFVLSVK